MKGAQISVEDGQKLAEITTMREAKCSDQDMAY
jgi:hypothetical protein